MKKKTVIQDLLAFVAQEVGSGVNVRTTGGDQDADPPEVILDYRESRISNANGHSPHVDDIEDENGYKVAKEYHSYWAAEADFQLRYYSEMKRDEMTDSVQAAFLPLEDNSDLFHEDTREWEVGSSGPRENSVIEPDWYSQGILVEFEYVKKTTAEAQPLEEIYVRNIEIEKIE